MNTGTHLFRYESPLGTIGLELDGNVCHRVLPGSIDATECSPNHPVALWLRAYFRGHHLSLPVIAPAKTEFQAHLRECLQKIPFGEIRTYGELAKQLNSAPRAVGQALGANPLPILIPCHRIVAEDGLGGFAFGSEWKRKLLTWEESI